MHERIAKFNSANDVYARAHEVLDRKISPPNYNPPILFPATELHGTAVAGSLPETLPVCLQGQDLQTGDQ